MVMRRSQRQRFQPSRLDYRLPGVPSSTPTAAQFLQIPSAAETSPEQRSKPPLTPVRQFDRSVRDGEIEDTIQRLQGEMDAITRELGEMNVRCSSSSDSRRGLDTREDFESRPAFDTRHNFKFESPPARNFESR